ncbi:SAM-dependent methyltransferase [Mesorhizobium sp. M0114]|uniref:SAM-dependent methyltransferase n=1 Tax=unclassified Mesorhizobium TaxID=325217 RepID=UPI003336B414
MQNTSHAVMAQRTEAKDSLDDFPTPPWATRALIEHVIGSPPDLKTMSCLEPACGVGHMAKVLREYFGTVDASDIHGYGYGKTRDFTVGPIAADSFDWVITNPPFRLAEEFVLRALSIASSGVAILVRTVFIESVGRYERLFVPRPPSEFAQFTERVAMVKGRLDRKASTATGYCWLVWRKKSANLEPKLVWIPPCRKSLEREKDYELPSPPSLSISINTKQGIVRQADLFGT